MTGKIFAESENIYQDQAKVLFNYYKAAAEKIVAEEIDLEKKIAEAQTEKEAAEAMKTPAMVKLIIGIVLMVLGIVVIAAAGSTVGGVFLIIVGIVLLIMGLSQKSKSTKQADEADQHILAFEQAKASIRRDYKVTKMGVAYVPVEMKVPFGEGHISVDLTEGTNKTSFSLSTIRKPEEWNETLSSLTEEIKNVPVVEGSNETEQLDTAEYSTSMQNVTMHDYMSSIDRQVRNIRYLLGDSEKKSVSLPLVKPASSEDNFLKEYATGEAPAGHPVVNVFDAKKFDGSLKVFNDINIMKKAMEQSDASQGKSHVDYYKALMQTLGESIQVISASKSSSCEKLIEYCNGIFTKVLKASYNQYSPALEAEEIERIRTIPFDFKEDSLTYKPFNLQASSRVKYDLFQSVWIAEDGSRTTMPFSMNQLQEEIFAPLIENLMEENRKDRLQVYNDIENQKTDYLNQWNRDADEFNAKNRAAAQDLIRDFLSANSEFQSALSTYKSLQETLDGMKSSGSLNNSEVKQKSSRAQILASMELQAQACKQRQDEFQDYMDRVAEDIQLKSEKFKYVEYYEGTLRDAEAKDIAVSAECIQDLDDRRKGLLAVNSYVAANAELPPEPQVESDLMEDFTLNLMKEVDALLEKNGGNEEVQSPFEQEESSAEEVVETEEESTEAAASEETEKSAESPKKESEEIADDESEGESLDEEEGESEEESEEEFEEVDDSEDCIFCSECGTKLPADAKFCENCGTPVDLEDDEEVEDVEGLEDEEEEEDEED